jgi:hypothetical protein
MFPKGDEGGSEPLGSKRAEKKSPEILNSILKMQDHNLNE